MADAVTNAFEIERRGIMWTPLITLNDGETSLGYDGNPNNVIDGNTPGETWLYSLPIGQFYKQLDATLWWKSEAPNTWINLSEGGGGEVYDKTLHLDQTTPQIIENGIPILNQTNGSFNNPLQLVNKDYIDKRVRSGGGFIAPVFFRTDDSDIAGYKRISYSNELTETEIPRTINAGMGIVECSTYLYDEPLGTTILDPGVYTANYRVKVSSAQGETQLIFTAFVRSEAGIETDLFSSYSSEIDNLTYETLRNESNEPSFTVNETDRFGVKICAVTTRVSDVIITTVVGGEHGSYFSTPIALKHSLLRGRDAVDQHPISAITGLETELGNKLETETDPTVPTHVKEITEQNITDWGSAFEWGDHSLEGYLTSFTETDPLSLHLDQTTPQEIINGIPKLITNFENIIDPEHIVNKEYLDKVLTTGSGYIANIYFRSDESDKPDTGDKYKRISYEVEESETILNRVINSSDGEVLYEIYLYDNPVEISFADPGVYCINYKVKVSDSANTHLIFELFALKSDNTEVVLFREESPQLSNTDYLTLRTNSNQPAFNLDPTDRTGVKIYCITDSVDDLIISTVIGGLSGSYFSTPAKLRHSIFRDIDAPNQHPISAITDLQTELDNKVDKEVFEALKEPTGVEDRTQSTLTFAVETNLAKVTIAPKSPATEFNIWTKGEKIVIDELKSITLPDSEGLHIIYFNSDGVLQSSLNPDYNDIKFIISEQVIIALLYWDATNKQIVCDGEERHGTIMDGETHAYLHIDRGLVINSGLGLSTFDIGNGSSNAHAQFGVNQGIVADEDLRITINEIIYTTGLPILHRMGTNGDWRKVIQTGFACYRGPNTRLSYNEFTGATWQLSEVDNNSFVLYHIFATTGYTNKIYSIMGQNQYGNSTQARAGAVEEISSLLLEGLPTPEIKPIGAVIFQTGNYGNLVNARIILTDEGANYVDWRASYLPRGTTPTYHGNLTGLNEDHHLQYLRTDGTRDITGIISYDADKTFTTDQDIISKKYVDDGLNTKEDYLGEPLVDDYVLSSKADGTRVWIEKPTGEVYDDTAIFTLANNNSLKFDETMGAGLASGGQITITGATTFNVSAGIGYVLNSSGKFIRVEWDSIDSAIIGAGSTYVRINELGNIDLTLDPNFDFTNYIELGYLFGGAGGTQILDLSPTPTWISKFNWRVNDFFRGGLKALIDSGCGVSEGATPFSLNIGSGIIRAFLNTLNVNSTSNFNKTYLTADYGWIPKDDTFNNLLEPNIYNNITENYVGGNPLVELTDGYWKNDLVFRNSSGQVYVVCGQAEYSTLEESKKSQLPATPEMLKNVSPYLARVHMQKDGTSIEEIVDIRPNFERIFGYGTAAAAAVQEHSSLTGLGNDDHVQYFNEIRGDIRYLKNSSISSWALEATKPSYDLDGIDDGATYRRVTESDITGWNSLISFPGFDNLLNDYGFTDNSTNWNTAFGWGDHSGLYSLLGHDHDGDYEPANVNIQTHISITSGNPHGTSKSDIGLSNVTNDAQVKKRASSTNGKVLTWNGTTGDSLNDGLTVGLDPENLVQLDALSRLPAVDGSQLTNLPPSGMIDPMTTRGDLIVRGSSGTTRLPLGAARRTLQSNGSDVVWSNELNIEVRTTNPTSPAVGRMWYRSDLE